MRLMPPPLRLEKMQHAGCVSRSNLYANCGPFPKCTHAVKTYKSNSRPDCDDDATFLPPLLAQDDHCSGGAAVAAPSVAVAAYGAVALMVIESASAARCQRLKQWY